MSQGIEQTVSQFQKRRCLATAVRAARSLVLLEPPLRGGYFDVVGFIFSYRGRQGTVAHLTKYGKKLLQIFAHDPKRQVMLIEDWRERLLELPRESVSRRDVGAFLHAVTRLIRVEPSDLTEQAGKVRLGSIKAPRTLLLCIGFYSVGRVFESHHRREPELAQRYYEQIITLLRVHDRQAELADALLFLVGKSLLPLVRDEKLAAQSEVYQRMLTNSSQMVVAAARQVSREDIGKALGLLAEYAPLALMCREFAGFERDVSSLYHCIECNPQIQFGWHETRTRVDKEYAIIEVASACGAILLQRETAAAIRDDKRLVRIVKQSPQSEETVASAFQYLIGCARRFSCQWLSSLLQECQGRVTDMFEQSRQQGTDCDGIF